MQLGRTCIFSQLEIISDFRLAGSNPPSGKESRIGHSLIERSRWLRLCMPIGKDLRSLQNSISMTSRDKLSRKLFATESSFSQLQIWRCLSVAGNSPLNIMDLKDGQYEINKYSRAYVLLPQLLISSPFTKICMLSQPIIVSLFRVGGSSPVAK